jgi:hypothetical protein
MLYSKLVNPVALPPGRARLWTMPAPTGSARFVNTIGMVRGCLLHWRGRDAAHGHDDIRRECNQFGRVLTNAVGLATSKAIIDLQVSADCPAQLLESLRKYRAPHLCLRIARN